MARLCVAGACGVLVGSLVAHLLHTRRRGAFEGASPPPHCVLWYSLARGSAPYKALVNDPEAVVDDLLAGLVLTQPQLRLLISPAEPHLRVVVRADVDSYRASHVTLVSGGGSGHEPAHAGLVGPGLLTAAVCGDVFASPSWAQVYAALRAVQSPHGTLLIVKNYSGDLLHFSMAKEFAERDGMRIEMVVVSDDCAFANRIKSSAARGLAGTAFVHKVAGALSAKGASLDEIVDATRKVAATVRTIGIALSPCIIPAVGTPVFTLRGNEIGLGQGIHGEAGMNVHAVGDRVRSDDVVKRLIDRLLASVPDRELVVLVNNLGSTTIMEMQIFSRDIALELGTFSEIFGDDLILEKRGRVISLLLVGPVLTSLNMAGVSVSFVPATCISNLLELLLAPTSVDAWPSAITPLPPPDRNLNLPSLPQLLHPQGGGGATSLGTLVCETIIAVCNSLRSSSNYLTRLDQLTGDGDMGVNVVAACKKIEHEIGEYPRGDDLQCIFLHLTYSLRFMGGTSGALFSTFFSRFADSFLQKDVRSILVWANAVEAGVDGIVERGGARWGMKTMIDALVPALDVLRVHAIHPPPLVMLAEMIAKAAESGAESTKYLTAEAGRTVHDPQRGIGQLDPGAVAIASIFRAISDHLRLRFAGDQS